jgi:predicted permease
MFAVSDPYLFRPLPYSDPSGLVTIRVGAAGLTPDTDIPFVSDWQHESALFQRLAAFQLAGPEPLRLADRSISLGIVKVSENLLELLGVPGTSWATSRMRVADGDQPVIVTSRGLAKLRGDQSERMVRQDHGVFEVVGALPGDFAFPVPTFTSRIDLLVPYRPGRVVEIQWSSARSRTLGLPKVSPTMIARLQTGLTPDDVQRYLSRPLPSGSSLDVRVDWLVDELRRPVRPFAIGAMACGALVLLLCIGNVANLWIGQSVYRAHEVATREALGASRLDIVRLWLLELGLLITVSVILGLTLASTVMVLVSPLIPEQYLSFGTPFLSRRVIVSAAIMGGIVLLIVSALVIPLTRSRRNRLPAAGGRGVRLLRVALCSSQVGVATVLAVGAAMLIQSHLNLTRQDSGLDESAVTVLVTYPASKPSHAVFDEVGSTLKGFARLAKIERAAATPGPLLNNYTGKIRTIVNGTTLLTDYTPTTTGFFDAAGMKVRQGRPLLAQDAGGRGLVVNEAFANEFWRDSDPIGQLVSIGDLAHQGVIVGVIRNVFDQRLDVGPTPTVYGLLDDGGRLGHRMVYVLRTASGSVVTWQEIQRVISGVDRDATVDEVDTLGERLAYTIRDRTFATFLLTCFGVAGAVVSLAGVSGIVAFVVARRTREIAIRMALGAARTNVVLLVTREALVACVLGGAAGLLIGRWLSSWLKSLVYGLEAGNWATSTSTAVLLSAVFVTVAVVSSRSATRLQPSQALRVN